MLLYTFIYIYRKAIFNWKPEEDSMEVLNKSLFVENSYTPETSVGHLQLVFALMQFGIQRSVDPEDFITTLRINTALQQDAHVSLLSSKTIYLKYTNVCEKIF